MNKIKKYKLSNEEISRIFEYKSPGAFNSSSARKRIKRAVERIILIVEDDLKNKVYSAITD